MMIQSNKNNMKTIDLQGKKYAQVKDRMKEFREDNPKGLIETTPTIQEDGQIMFKARILKDKSDETSAEASGHAMGANKGAKAFEKLETIAVGRALALLGYGSDGAIASSEEMEEFLSYKSEKKDDAMDSLKATTDLDQLREVFMSLGNLMADKEIIALKNKLKKEHENN